MKIMVFQSKCDKVFWTIEELEHHKKNCERCNPNIHVVPLDQVPKNSKFQAPNKQRCSDTDLQKANEWWNTLSPDQKVSFHLDWKEKIEKFQK